MAALITLSIPESVEEYWRIFNARTKECKDILSTIQSNESTADQLIALTTIKEAMVELQKWASEATGMLPSYDVRRSQEEIEIVNKSCRDVELAVRPKKKFTFGSKTKAPPREKKENPISAEADMKESTTSASPSRAVSGSYIITQKKSEVITLTRQDLEFIDGVRGQLFVKDCSSTVISAMSVLGSVRLENLYNCSIFLGPCCTSVYLEGCIKCTIFIACHQLRIHTCSDCNLHVRVQSHPIIEDCRSMGFAPYYSYYEGIERDLEVSNLALARCWSNVVDFRWHKSTPSPNWHVIPPQNRNPWQELLKAAESSGEIVEEAAIPTAPTPADVFTEAGWSFASTSSWALEALVEDKGALNSVAVPSVSPTRSAPMSHGISSATAGTVTEACRREDDDDEEI